MFILEFILKTARFMEKAQTFKVISIGAVLCVEHFRLYIILLRARRRLSVASSNSSILSLANV